MIHKIDFGENNKQVLEVVFGSGDIMFHGLKFPERPTAYCLGFSQMPARPIGAETNEFAGLTTDELPAPTQLVFSFERPESVTALIHSLVELQKRMFDKDQELIV